MQKYSAGALAVLMLAAPTVALSDRLWPAVYADSAVVSTVSVTNIFTITRTVSGVAKPVTATFYYHITADSNNPAAVTGLPTMPQVVFSAATPGADNKVTATATFDMSSVQYSQVGDYAFLVTENDSSDPVNYPADSAHNFTIVASVRNAVDGSGNPTGDFVVQYTAQVKNVDGEKTEDIAFEVASMHSYVQIENAVTGNIADTNKFFKYKVTISNAPAGESYVIDGQDVEVSYGGGTITTQTVYTVGEDNYIYLKHGQTATIGQTDDGLGQLTVGNKYTVELIGEDDYDTYIDGATETQKLVENKNILPRPEMVTDQDITDLFAASNVTKIVNNKETSENVLTGVMVNLLPLLAVAVLGAGAYALTRKNTKKNANKN